MADNIKNFGTVMKLNLQDHDTFGSIEVGLAAPEIRRLIELAFERLPDKTDYQKKCKDSVMGWLFNVDVDITIFPVLNKDALKERKSYKI